MKNHHHWKIRALLGRITLLTILWILLTGARLDGLIFGLVVVPVAVWLSLRLMPCTYCTYIQPLKYWTIATNIPHFLWRSLLGGFNVAWWAFRSPLKLRPAWVLVSVELTGGSRVALGSLVSLMPGTLAAGESDGKMVVHVLDQSQSIANAMRRDEATILQITQNVERGQ